jgi:hypothetical protein
VARLVFFTAVSVLLALLPLLESAACWSSPVGVAIGIVVPVLCRAWIVRDPQRTIAVLRGLGVALPLAALTYQYAKLPTSFVGGVSALAVGWAAIWVLLMTESEVAPVGK